MAGKHDDNVPEATDVPENNNNACPEDPKKHDDRIPGDTVQQGGDDRDNAGDDHEEDKLARALAKARKKEEEERSKMTPKIKVIDVPSTDPEVKKRKLVASQVPPSSSKSASRVSPSSNTSSPSMMSPYPSTPYQQGIV